MHNGPVSNLHLETQVVCLRKSGGGGVVNLRQKSCVYSECRHTHTNLFCFLCLNPVLLMQLFKKKKIFKKQTEHKIPQSLFNSVLNL